MPLLGCAEFCPFADAAGVCATALLNIRATHAAACKSLNLTFASPSSRFRPLRFRRLSCRCCSNTAKRDPKFHPDERKAKGRFSISSTHPADLHPQRPYRSLIPDIDVTVANVTASTNWKLTLAYDGSGFHGWQIQSPSPASPPSRARSPTRSSASPVSACLPQGSGRTDAGVHALAQVVSFRLAAPIPAANLHRALNRILPAGIRVLSGEAGSAQLPRPPQRPLQNLRVPHLRAPHPPHARPARRSSASARPSSHPTPGTAAGRSRSTPCSRPPHSCSARTTSPPWPRLIRTALFATRSKPARDAMPRTTTHPHRAPSKSTPSKPSRTPSGPPARSPALCTLGPGRWPLDRLLIFRITGSGFLHHMVRNIVGTLVEIGRGTLSTLPTSRASSTPATAPPPAPPHPPAASTSSRSSTTTP